MGQETVELRPAVVRLLWFCACLAAASAVLAVAPLFGWHPMAFTRTAGVVGLALFGCGLLVRLTTTPRPGNGAAGAGFGVLLVSALASIVSFHFIGGLLASAIICGCLCMAAARHGAAPVDRGRTRRRA